MPSSASGLGWPGILVDPVTTPLGYPTRPPQAPAPRDVPRGTSVAGDAAEVPTAGRLVETDSGAVADGRPEQTPIAQAAAAAVRVRTTGSTAPFPRPPLTRRIVVANQKGGVGKTTSTVNIAAALALGGLRVLVVDLDPQGNASTAFGVEHHVGVPSVYEVLGGTTPMADVLAPVPDVPGLVCVPATIALAGAEIELVSLVARENRLRNALSTFLDTCSDRDDCPDYVLIDCPPSLGLLTVNAFVAADEVLLPIQCEYYALEGVSQLMSNVELVRDHLNPRLEVRTVLLTMHDARTRLSSQVAQEVRAHFGDLVLGTAIPRSVRISEAPSFGRTVMTYDPACSGALSYLEAARELAARGAKQEVAAG